MTNRVIEHKIKLEKSVKIILGVLAFGVFLNAFAPAFDVRKAFADGTGQITLELATIQHEVSYISNVSRELSKIERAINNH